MKTATVDDRHRIRIPDLKPGQVLAYQNNGDGSYTLLPVKVVERKTSILDGLKPMTDAEAEKLYKTPNPEFDELEHHCAQLPANPPTDLD